MIVSNPPYLDDAEIAALEPDVRDFEPRVALSAGAGRPRYLPQDRSGRGARILRAMAS